MAIDYRKLVEDPAFDLMDFLRSLAFPLPPLNGKRPVEPVMVRAGGPRVVVTEVVWNSPSPTGRESSIEGTIRVRYQKIDEH